MKNIHFAKNRIVLMALCSFILIFSASGQNLDSLENVLHSEKITLQQKIDAYNDLSWGYMTDFNKAKKYALLAISAAKQAKDESKEAQVQYTLGNVYYQNTKYDTAKIYLNTALKLALKTKNDKTEAAVYGTLGNIYNILGDYQQSLSFYLKTLPLLEKQKNEKRQQAVLNNIGMLFLNLNNYDEGKKYFQKSLVINTKIKNEEDLGFNFNGLSRVFLQNKQNDSALVYGKKAIDAFEKAGDKFNQTIGLQVLSMIYYDNLKNYSLAETYAVKALSISNELGNKRFISSALNTLSNIYFYQEKYQKCLDYAFKAVQTDSTDMGTLQNMYANVVRGSVGTGNKKQAFDYLEKFAETINNKANKEYQQSFSEMQTKYETVKKDNEIYKLSVQKKEKNRLIYLLLSAVAILSLLIFFIFRDKKKSKIISDQTLQMKEQQIVEMEKERRLIVAKSVLEGEETERARLANDLHDGLGGLLSGVKLNLSSMKENNILTAENTVSFNNTLGLLDNSIKELRRIAHNLMPENLMRFGLKYAVSEFVASLNNSEKTKIEFAFYGEETRYTKELELSVYRITQELVNNALKYSQAANVNVQLILENERINLQVIDNGIGFDTSVIDTCAKGTGLQQIRNRISALNGKFEINSSPNDGTEVYIEISSI